MPNMFACIGLIGLVFWGGALSAQQEEQQADPATPHLQASGQDVPPTDASTQSPSTAGDDSDSQTLAPDEDDANGGLSSPTPAIPPVEELEQEDVGTSVQQGAKGSTSSANKAPPREDASKEGNNNAALDEPGTNRERNWWKGIENLPGEEPLVYDEEPKSTKVDALPPPRSGPGLSIGASAATCLGVSCLGPLCTVGSLVTAVGLLAVPVPSAALGVVSCTAGILACGGPTAGLCLTGPIGGSATTAAAAAAPYWDEDENQAAWDAAVAGLPALVVGIASFALLPVTLVISFAAASTAIGLTQPQLGSQSALVVIALIIVSLGILPSLVMGACAPILAFVGTSGARVQFAISGPEAHLTTYRQATTAHSKWAMRY